MPLDMEGTSFFSYRRALYNGQDATWQLAYSIYDAEPLNHHFRGLLSARSDSASA